MKALAKAKKAGKTRFVGITTHRNEPEVIQAAIDSKLYDVVLTAYNFRQKHSAEVRKAMAKAAEAGLGIVAMKTIGGNIRGAYGQEQIDARAALKWALQDPNVHTIIAGFTTFDQMELDLSVMEDLALTRSEKENLQRGASVAGLYCQGCEQCLRTCPHHLPIPDLMRAYMYVYGYRNLSAAQDLLLSLDLPVQLCEDCSRCSVQCLNGFNVAGRIRDVIRLREVPSEFIG
jgi:predicted aldo/keto reductase-like oxidoreductase